MAGADDDTETMTMHTLHQQLPDRLVAHVRALPEVRPDAVARGRALVDAGAWCRADEVAAELVDCLVGHRLP